MGEPEPECWLHPAVEVRPSPVAGDGLFSPVPLAAGTPVSRLGGRLVTGPELARLFAEPARSYLDTITVTTDRHLLLPPGHAQRQGKPRL